MRKLIAGAAAVLAVASLGACGGAGGGSDEDQLRDRAHAMYERVMTGDPDTCEYMTDHAKDEMVRGMQVDGTDAETCEAGMVVAGVLLKGMKLDDPGQVTRTAVHGDRAVVTTKSELGMERATWVKADGVWMYDTDSPEES